MEAKEKWLLKDVLSNGKIYQIPFYQRNYEWGEKQCNPLLDDVETILKKKCRNHFMGSIVLFSAKGKSGSGVAKFMVVDGQQRLTTIILLLKALAENTTEQESKLKEEIFNTYIYNQYVEDDSKIKLKPVSSDERVFEDLMSNQWEALKGTKSSLYSNYTLFYNKIAEWKQKYRIEQIKRAIEQIQVVEIILEQGTDDAQLIFESLNTTGKGLALSDSIRNFLLMNVNSKKQRNLYQNYWLPLERKLIQEVKDKKKSFLDDFFTHYLVYKNHTIVNEKDLYTTFRKEFYVNNYDNENILKELKGNSDIYAAFISEKGEMYSEGIKRYLKIFRQLQQSTCYPFLLDVFNDYKNEKITEEILLKVLHLLAVYLLRRRICGVPSNSLDKFFSSLYTKVFKIPSNKEKYYGAINKYLFTLKDKNKIPLLEEFKKGLKAYPLYKDQPLARFILDDIENGDAKEKVATGEMQIEHIMPQTLGPGWAHITQETHETLLDTLGNLTLTGLNQDLSNLPFEQKKKKLVENARVKILNEDIINQEVWDQKSINTRAKHLSEIIAEERYKVEEIKDKDIEFELTEKVYLDSLNSEKLQKLYSFILGEEEYSVKKPKDILYSIIGLLQNKYSDRFKNLVVEGICWSTRKGPHMWISTDQTGLGQNPEEIGEGVYIAKLNNPNIPLAIKSLLEAFEIPETDFYVKVKTETQSSSEEPDEDCE